MTFFNLSRLNVLGAKKIKHRSSGNQLAHDNAVILKAKRLFDEVVRSDGFVADKAIFLFPDDGDLVAAFMIIWINAYGKAPMVALSFAGTEANPPCPKSATDILAIAGIRTSRWSAIRWLFRRILGIAGSGS